MTIKAGILVELIKAGSLVGLTDLARQGAMGWKKLKALPESYVCLGKLADLDHKPPPTEWGETLYNGIDTSTNPDAFLVIAAPYDIVRAGIGIPLSILVSDSFPGTDWTYSILCRLNDVWVPGLILHAQYLYLICEGELKTGGTPSAL